MCLNGVVVDWSVTDLPPPLRAATPLQTSISIPPTPSQTPTRAHGGPICLPLSNYLLPFSVAALLFLVYFNSANDWFPVGAGHKFHLNGICGMDAPKFLFLIARNC